MELEMSSEFLKKLPLDSEMKYIYRFHIFTVIVQFFCLQ
jgi:predicted permease